MNLNLVHKTRTLVKDVHCFITVIPAHNGNVLQVKSLDNVSKVKSSSLSISLMKYSTCDQNTKKRSPLL